MSPYLAKSRRPYAIALDDRLSGRDSRVDLRDYPEEEFDYPRIKCREHGCDNILRTSWEHGTGLCWGCSRERAGNG